MATLPPLTTSLNYTIAVLSAYGEFDGVPLTHDQIVYQLTHYDESKVGSLIAAVDIMLVATTLAVAMRLLSRKLKKVKLDVDDYMALIGLILFYGYVTSFCVLIHYGLGLHAFRAGTHNILRIGKAFYVFDILYGPVCFTTKMSVLLLYRRIFTLPNRAWRISFWTITGLFIGWSIANLFKDVFQAVPIRAAWGELVPAKWINSIQAFFIMGLINAILTIAIIILPMPLIRQMQLPRGKRIGLCLIFALGCGDVVVIIARSVELKIQKFPSTDFTWNVMPASVLAVIEQALGILCASLPMTRSIIARLLKPRKNTSSYPLTQRRTPGLSSTQSSNPPRDTEKHPDVQNILMSLERGGIPVHDRDKMSDQIEAQPPQQVRSFG